MFCTYTWPIYQVSVYRTIGPLVRGINHDFPFINIRKVLSLCLK